MLLAGVLLSIIIGYIRGGKLRRFENITIKLWYFISVAFLIQTIALRVPQINDNMFYILHLLSYVIIIYVCIIVNMLHMFMYLFNYIMFIVVMVMSCNIVGDITCIEVLFSKILIINNIFI